MKSPEADTGGMIKRRRGPFGPAEALLPQDQQILTLEESTPASDAIERMVDNGFSQIPVTNVDRRIVGVFSWQSFGKRVADLRSTKIKAMELPLRLLMEPAKFIKPDVYIDTETDWDNIDYVLVSEDDRLDSLKGILCIADVFGRLNDFAEAFVLLFEIEHEIRDLIRDVLNPSELQKLIGNMSLPPNARPPESLRDFSFSQYSQLMCNKNNWTLFEPVFRSMRELVNTDLADINDLRNTVFHFRRGITPKDTDRLRRFRDRLRDDREYYAKAKLSAAS